MVFSPLLSDIVSGKTKKALRKRDVFKDGPSRVTTLIRLFLAENASASPQQDFRHANG